MKLRQKKKNFQKTRYLRLEDGITYTVKFTHYRDWKKLERVFKLKRTNDLCNSWGTITKVEVET